MFKEVWYHPEQDKIVEVRLSLFESVYAVLDENYVLYLLHHYGYVEDLGSVEKYNEGFF